MQVKHPQTKITSSNKVTTKAVNPRATGSHIYTSNTEASDDFDIVVKQKISNETNDLTYENDGLPKYFTEKDLSRILKNLDTLRAEVYPSDLNDDDDKKNPNFPSVCLIGLGRCGSNIALDVASLVHNARNYYLNEFHDEENKRKENESSAVKWIQKSLKIKNQQVIKPIFLMEPLVMLGDLDKDIAGRIRFSSKGESNNFLAEYNKLKIMDLSEVHAGGSGNAPILGQYLAKMILNKETVPIY